MGLFGFTKAAKAARECQRIRNDPELLAKHPWGKDLENVAHVGWASGAPNPDRNDWSALQGVEKVYHRLATMMRAESGQSIEFPGGYPAPVYHIQFSEQFPSGFDLGDPFPKKMFQKRSKKGGSHYDGPTVLECLFPATWATEKIEAETERKNGRPAYRMRDCFADQWVWLPSLQIIRAYLNPFGPDCPRTPGESTTAVFRMSPGSRINFFANPDSCRSRAWIICREFPERLVSSRGQRMAMNLFFDSSVEPRPDISPRTLA